MIFWMVGIQPMMKMTMISAGTPYFIQPYSHFGNLMPEPVLHSSMKFFQPQPLRVVQKSTKISEPIGSRLLDTMKSSRPSTEPPMTGAKPLHTFMPSTAGMASTKMPMPVISELLPRLQPHSSMPKAMMFSNTAMTVDRAAKAMNRKNRVPQNCPPHICWNTLGRVMKARPAPLSGCTPKAKQAGKMMRPAMRATKVSRAPMVTASLNRPFSLPM